uniref:hydroxyacylglutathione hydrolase n=1 Tax=Panagrellus redivivus TaxID=6233 RepID=A0A7E4W8A3_PANRE
MKIVPIPAFRDNYQYLVIDDKGTKQAAIVDPVDIDSIQENVLKEKVKLVAGFVTHHHNDHSNHAHKLVPTFGNEVTVYGNDEARIAGQTKNTTDGGVFKIGNLGVKTLHTPCHTTTHVCFFVDDLTTGEKAVFTGDTLFIGGSGRFFEGTAEQMDAALNTKLASLPDDTKVYCGHEYTVGNLKFAATVDGENPHVRAKLRWAEEQRANHQFTVPSSIGDEKKFNPFMRVREPALKKATGKEDPLEVMDVLRTRKNNF